MLAAAPPTLAPVTSSPDVPRAEVLHVRGPRGLALLRAALAVVRAHVQLRGAPRPGRALLVTGSSSHIKVRTCSSAEIAEQARRLGFRGTFAATAGVLVVLNAGANDAEEATVTPARVEVAGHLLGGAGAAVLGAALVDLPQLVAEPAGPRSAAPEV